MVSGFSLVGTVTGFYTSLDFIQPWDYKIPNIFSHVECLYMGFAVAGLDASPYVCTFGIETISAKSKENFFLNCE
jgi:hypothetical protein